MVSKVFFIIKVCGFADGYGSIRLDDVDSVAVASTGDDYEVIIRINQAVVNTDEYRLLLSMFQSRYSCTKVDNDKIQFNMGSRFGTIFHNRDTGTSIVKFDLKGVAMGFHICNPTEKDLEILPMHEVTS